MILIFLCPRRCTGLGEVWVKVFLGRDDQHHLDGDDLQNGAALVARAMLGEAWLSCPHQLVVGLGRAGHLDELPPKLCGLWLENIRRWCDVLHGLFSL